MKYNELTKEELIELLEKKDSVIAEILHNLLSYLDKDMLDEHFDEVSSVWMNSGDTI